MPKYTFHNFGRLPKTKQDIHFIAGVSALITPAVAPPILFLFPTTTDWKHFAVLFLLSAITWINTHEQSGTGMEKEDKPKKDPVYDIDLQAVRHTFNVWRRDRILRWFFIITFLGTVIVAIWGSFSFWPWYDHDKPWNGQDPLTYMTLALIPLMLVIPLWELHKLRKYTSFQFKCPSPWCNTYINLYDPWKCPFCPTVNGGIAQGVSHTFFSKCIHCKELPHAHQCPWCGFVFALLFGEGVKIFKYSKRPDVNLTALFPQYPAPHKPCPEVSGAYDAEYYVERALCLYKQQFPSGCFLISVDALSAYQLVEKELKAQEPVSDKQRVLSDAVYSILQTKAQQTFVPYGLPDEQRMEHHWVVASSGAGKTQMLQAMIAEDIEKGIPEANRRPIYLYIDEGGDYGDDKAFTNIISQCRKYKAGLIFCNQYLGQLSPEVLGSMMACAIKCVSSLEDPTETKKMANSLRVDENFIRNLRKDKQGSQWALYVRGQNTIQVRVPFGVVEAKEKRLDFDAFKEENRAKYCVRPAPKQTTTVYRAGKRVLLPHNAPDESYFD